MKQVFHLVSTLMQRIFGEIGLVAAAILFCLAALSTVSPAQGIVVSTKVVDIKGFIDPACTAPVADGQSHPLSSCYRTLGDARRKYPGASELSQEYAGTVIQSALDSMGAAGGIVVLPCGVYLASTAIRITDNKTLQGSGDCTVLKKSGNDSLLFLTGSAPVLRDLMADGYKDQGHKGINIAINDASGAVIRDCAIINGDTNGISLFRSSGTVIRANRVRGNGNTAIFAAQNVDRNQIQDNDIDVPSSAKEAAQGVQFRSNAAGATADRNVINFNRIRVGTRMGYCLEAAGTGGIPAKSDQVAHNECVLTANALGGYSIADAVGTVVTSNTFDANGFNATYTGIELVNVSQAVVEYNTLVGHGKLARGIWCSKNNTGNTIRLNEVNGIAAAGVGIDIVTTTIGETASGNRVDDNVIRFQEPSPDTKGMWLFCPSGATCNDNEFARNSVLNSGLVSGQGIRLENYGTMEGTILQDNSMENVAVCVSGQAQRNASTQNKGSVCQPSKPPAAR
jgi:parallel beta-helix repeat protein